MNQNVFACNQVIDQVQWLSPVTNGKEEGRHSLDKAIDQGQAGPTLTLVLGRKARDVQPLQMCFILAAFQKPELDTLASIPISCQRLYYKFPSSAEKLKFITLLKKIILYHTKYFIFKILLLMNPTPG